jgi:hypothetical protein
MPIHVAILKRPYLKLILAGRKTVESRLMRTAQPPFQCIEPGERIFLKASSGPFMATAIAGKVDQHDKLEPYDILRLRVLHDKAVCGDDAYWQMKRDSRFAVFVELTEVEPIEVGPKYPKSMRAWHVVDEKLSPLMDVTLTAGAIRNRYLSLPGTSAKMRRGKVTLLMPDGEEIATGFAAGKPMLKWRGWGHYYDVHGVKPGDVVRVVALGAGRYRVTFRHG